MTVLGNVLVSKHLFEINTQYGMIEVHANTRSQAAAMARKAGYVVKDVNVVG